LKTALPEESQPHWVSATKSPPIPQPTHGINGPELMELMRQQAKNFGTRIVTEDVVKVNLKTKPFELYLSDGQSVKALSVIIATGARANYLGLPSEDKFKTRGVSACAVCDGALPRYKNKPVVVIGGGDSAVEEASYLAKFTSEVALVVRRDVLRASKIMADRAKNNAKIKMRWNSVIDEVLGNDKDGVTAVRIKDVKSGKVDDYAAAGMFCAIGHTPNTAFLDGQIELNEKSYIKWTTPARTFTSVEGVFAAGDVADDYYRQAVTAAGTGCMAALDAERYLSHHGLI
jgi:thioredoxin reductase (NADPH)